MQLHTGFIRTPLPPRTFHIMLNLKPKFEIGNWKSEIPHMPTRRALPTAPLPHRRRQRSRRWPSSSARPSTSTTRPRSSSGSTTSSSSTSSATPRRPARTSPFSTCVRRHGVVVDAVSAGEIHRALTAGYKARQQPNHPEIVYTADIFDRESLDLVVKLGIPVNCGSPDMIDQLGERAARAATSRCGSIPASATATARRPTPAASNRSTASGTSSSTTASRRADQPRPGDHRPAHAHRLRHRPGAPRPRSAARWKRPPSTVGRIDHHDQRRRRPADALSRRPDRTSISTSTFELWDASRKRLEDEVRPPADARDRAGPLPRRRERLPHRRDPRHQADGRQHVLPARRRLQQSRPADPLRRLSPDVDLPSERRRSARRSAATQRRRRRRPAVRIGRHLHAGRRRLRLPSAHCPPPSVGDYLVIERAGAYGFVMASNYNSKPLAAEVLIQNGQPHLIRSRQTLDDLIRGEAIPS